MNLLKKIVPLFTLIISPVFLFAQKDTVNMLDYKFEPLTLTIEAGDTVIWINKSIGQHTTTSGKNCNKDGKWDSGYLNKEETFSFIFTDTGTYDYYCVPHCLMEMKGIIEVQPVGEKKKNR